MIRTQRAQEEADQVQEETMNAGTVARQATGQTNAEVGDEIRTETGVGRDAEVILVIEDGRHQEVEDQVAVIRGTQTEEKEGALVARREVTSEQTAQTIPSVVETLVTSTGEEMIEDMVEEMLPAEETTQEADHRSDVDLVEIMTRQGILPEAVRPHPVITDVMTAGAPILGLTTD